MKKIKIKIGERIVDAELNDTKVAQAVWEKLPIETGFNTWGDEIYFSIPVFFSEEKLENPKEAVAVGDLGYWPSGNAFCIFFGKTPASTETEIRPASPVEVIGKFEKVGISLFKKVQEGGEIIINRV